MGTSKGLDEADRNVAKELQRLVQETGLSYRDIAAKTGMSINRIGKILRQEPPPATMGEIHKIASAAGSTASQVVGRAEADNVIEFPHLSAVPDSVAAYKNDGTHKEFDESQWD